jgi:uncharacterized MAPEG superfamily protein
MLVGVAALAALTAQGTKSGNPEEHLPADIIRLTAFGERASWAPDGARIAFMSFAATAVYRDLSWR